MQDFRPIIDAFLTKIEQAPAFLPPAIAEERAKEEVEAQDTKETARELRDAKAALQDAQEREAVNRIFLKAHSLCRSWIEDVQLCKERPSILMFKYNVCPPTLLFLPLLSLTPALINRKHSGALQKWQPKLSQQRIRTAQKKQRLSRRQMRKLLRCS